jgi:hypothetical protein
MTAMNRNLTAVDSSPNQVCVDCNTFQRLFRNNFKPLKYTKETNPINCKRNQGRDACKSSRKQISSEGQGDLLITYWYQ